MSMTQLREAKLRDSPIARTLPHDVSACCANHVWPIVTKFCVEHFKDGRYHDSIARSQLSDNPLRAAKLRDNPIPRNLYVFAYCILTKWWWLYRAKLRDKNCAQFLQLPVEHMPPFGGSLVLTLFRAAGWWIHFPLIYIMHSTHKSLFWFKKISLGRYIEKWCI